MTLNDWSDMNPAARRLLWAVLAASLLLRLGLAASTHLDAPIRFLSGDSGSYWEPARALLIRGEFTQSPTSSRPELVRTPGYPVFLAGLRLAGLTSLAAVVVAQSIISTATLAAVFWIGLMLFGARAALAGLVLAALDFSGVLFSQLVMAETLFTFLLVLSSAMGVRLLEGEGRLWPWALGLGLALSAATLTRPVTVFYIYPLLLLAGAGLWQRRGLGAAVGAVLIVGLCWAGLVGGWQARNYALSGSAALSHIVGHNLLKYWAAEIVAVRDGVSRQEAAQLLRAELGHPEKSGLPDREVQEIYTTKTLEVMRENPGLALKGALKGLVAMVVVPLAPDFSGHLGKDAAQGPLGDLLRTDIGQWAERWIVQRPGRLLANLFALAYLGAIYLGALWALVQALRGTTPHGWGLAQIWLTVLYIVGISIAPSAYHRLMSPVIPLLCVLAADGWRRLLGSRRGWPEAPDVL